ncbi:MAG: peptidoglycan DD-metalloendopeptidase family protein [Proteobacteria bacterium]|nr:peptidoglycan DD-metalloendopeptidase family protein [Pseudomonadota bacterium]MDA1022803.1 peptidoglycan DD-metalloendopeptidase family protein [Pseudomonadota bacterium]
MIKFKPLIARTAFSAFIALIALAMVGTAGAAPKKDPKSEKRLKEVVRELDKGREKARTLKEKADKIEQDLAILRRDMVAAAAIIQDQERKATVVAKALVDLETQAEAKIVWLSKSRGQLAGILAALQRVARYPPEALITQPRPPGDTVRSAILLRAAVPQIERRASLLRADIESLAESRRKIAEKKAIYASAMQGLEKKRQHLAVLFGQNTALKHRTLAERKTAARRLKSLSGEAVTLRDLLNRLSKESEKEGRESSGAKAKEIIVKKMPSSTRPAPDSGKKLTGLPAELTGAPISRQRGKLPPPAVGRITGRYGQTMKAGLTQKGMTLETAPGAQVVAPYEGRIVYAGKFRGYGELLIIEHGEGYHSLLSGLERIDSAMGQWVVAGEPVGVMGRPGRNKQPQLYIELRRNGQPINPLPWLAVNR